MKFLFTLPFAILFIVKITYAQPTLQWQKAVGGSDYDYTHSIHPTSDGGYIMASYAASKDGDISGNHGGSDIWVVKFNNTGTIQWQKTLGGSSGEGTYSIQPTSDNGYIIAGNSSSNNGDVSGNHGGSDVWVVKLNNTGTIQWQKSLGGSGHEFAYSIQTTNDGGYIVAGYSSSNDGDVSVNHGGSDVWVVKLNNTGTIQWQKSLGGSKDEFANSIQTTSDGGCIIAGYTQSNDGDVSGNHGNKDAWVVKLNNSGSIQWQKSLGGSNDENAHSIQITNDGGYIVSGYSGSNDGNVSGNHGGLDAWVVKLNNTGVIQWQKSLGGSDGESAYSIQTTSDGGYIVASFSGSNDGDVSGNHGGNDAWIVKLNNAGMIHWQKSLGGSDYDYAYSIRNTSDGGYIMAGFSASNNGDVSGNHGGGDIWVVKLNSTTGIEDYQNNINWQIFPNPTTGIVEIQINESNPDILVSLLDVFGRHILEQNFSIEGRMDISDLPNGVYLILVHAQAGEIYQKKIVKQ